MIPVYKPRIYKDSVVKALESGWISSQGEFIQKATDSLKEFFSIPYVILMNNGTSATHMLLKALHFKYPSIKKLYVPNNVFVAVWNVVLYDNYFNMEVLEMDSKTLNIRTDEEYIQTLDKDSAVFIVHNVGNIVNVPRLKRLRPDLIFIEDNCEGLFGKYEGLYSGMSEASLCSACSFFGNKIITSGEGGAFFTHDKDVYDFIYSTIHHGLGTKQFVYSKLGYNYRMTNIQAALLYDQMQNIQSTLQDKEKIFSYYRRMLNKNSIVYTKQEEGTLSANWMFIIGINIPYEKVNAYMKSKSIDTRPFFYDIQTHEHLKHIQRSNFELDLTYIILPSYPDLTEKEISYISETLSKYLEVRG